MTMTKAKLTDKKGYNFIFELENGNKIEVSISKENQEFTDLLDKMMSRAQRSDLYFNISINPSGDKLYLNDCVLLTEVKNILYEKTRSYWGQ